MLSQRFTQSAPDDRVIIDDEHMRFFGPDVHSKRQTNGR
jgi:hypothetical protein